MKLPLCFVLMPFGIKMDEMGRSINFDKIYEDLITPAIRDAKLEPLRADEEVSGGLIHKPMYERLILCEYAVADLTTTNANVFYELGVRHATRPWSTVAIFASNTRLPFDVSPFRALPYDTNDDGSLKDINQTHKLLAQRLNDAREAYVDSPIFQLIQEMKPQEIDHTKTDTFREKINYNQKIKQQLAEAREKDAAAITQVEETLKPIQDQEAGVVIDLFLSYRAVKDWKSMIRLKEEMSSPLAQTVMVQEQLALALNRDGQGKQAEQALVNLIDNYGPSSETFGILGRVYKDQWEAAAKAGKTVLANGLLDKAIDTYLKGFEADWRDAYPGINAVTLMELKNPPDSRLSKVLPVVFYAVEQKIKKGTPDYWDSATLLELSVLAGDKDKSSSYLAKSLALVREVWEPETTARNIRLIRESRESRGESVSWIAEIEEALKEV